MCYAEVGLLYISMNKTNNNELPANLKLYISLLNSTTIQIYLIWLLKSIVIIYR